MQDVFVLARKKNPIVNILNLTGKKPLLCKFVLTLTPGCRVGER